MGRFTDGPFKPGMVQDTAETVKEFAATVAPLFENNSDPAKPATLDDTLAERGARYGSFVDHAAIAEGFVTFAMAQPGWAKLAPDMRQSFRMFADKQARILSGDPNYSDSWHDIAGYATLIDKRLKSEGK